MKQKPAPATAIVPEIFEGEGVSTPTMAGEWTEHELNELVMDLRVAEADYQRPHAKFLDVLKPWFDAHNSALAAERDERKIVERSRKAWIRIARKSREQLAAAVEAGQEALVAIGAWKISDEQKFYAEVGDDLRKQFIKAHDLLLSALAKIREGKR